MLDAIASGRPLADALDASGVSGRQLNRWWTYSESFRQQWALACEVLRDSIVQEARERAHKGDDASLRTLLATLNGPLTPAKAGRAKRALRARWWNDIRREAQAQKRLRKQLDDVAFGRAAPVGSRRDPPDEQGYSW